MSSTNEDERTLLDTVSALSEPTSGSFGGSWKATSSFHSASQVYPKTNKLEEANSSMIELQDEDQTGPGTFYSTIDTGASPLRYHSIIKVDNREKMKSNGQETLHPLWVILDLKKLEDNDLPRHNDEYNPEPSDTRVTLICKDESQGYKVFRQEHATITTSRSPYLPPSRPNERLAERFGRRRFPIDLTCSTFDGGLPESFPLKGHMRIADVGDSLDGQAYIFHPEPGAATHGSTQLMERASSHRRADEEVRVSGTLWVFIRNGSEATQADLQSSSKESDPLADENEISVESKTTIEAEDQRAPE